MELKKLIRTATTVTILVLTFTGLFGQPTRNDVIKVYNEGAKAMQTDVKAAITAFENVITISDQVGETAADLRQKAVQVLPGLYFKSAYNMLNEKKPANEVIKASKVALASAEKYGSATNKENSVKVLAQAYINLASEYFSKNDFDNALVTFDSVLTISPDNVNAIYNKSLVYRRQNNTAAYEETIDLYIEKLKAASDQEKVDQASSQALEYFRAAGSQASQADNLDEALTLLDKAAKYGDDKDLFYYYADVFNKKKDFDKGLEYSKKGLALETGDAEAKAKYYFQLGLAQSGKGQTSEACDSFKNSSYGAFAAASKAERTNLKCQ